MTIDFVPRDEVKDFTGRDALGGCWPDFEYRRAIIKVSEDLPEEEAGKVLKHELDHLTYAGLTSSIEGWCDAWAPLLPQAAVSTLLGMVDKEIHRLMEKKK